MDEKVTRKDIAKKAGVSVSVVSRALNNSGYVEKNKKKKVIEIASQLGYNPNPVAMSLQKRRTNQLTFFCNDLTGAYYNQMYHGIVREAYKRGYKVLLNLSYDFEDIKRTFTDGVIFPSEIIAEDYAKTAGKNYHLPAVSISFDPSFVYSKPTPSVTIDNNKVINIAIDYLMERGHRKIGIALPYDNGYSHKRYKLWKERMRYELDEKEYKYCFLFFNNEKANTRHISLLNEYKCLYDNFEYYSLFEVGRKAAVEFKKAKYKPTAIICFNDEMAFGMISQLNKLNINVPEDVSIMGIDGVYTREYFRPELTSVSLYPDVQGAKCANLLIDVLESKKHKFLYESAIGIIEGETVKDIMRDRY